MDSSLGPTEMECLEPPSRKPGLSTLAGRGPVLKLPPHMELQVRGLDLPDSEPSPI